MGYDLNSGFQVAIKRQLGLGVQATDDATAQIMRLTDSPGLGLDMAQIQSNEKRLDKTKPMGRLGSQTTPGSYNGELTVGGVIDLLAESILRGTWTATLAVGTAQMGGFNFSTTANTIVATGGSWITAGIRVNDVITITGDTTTTNNNIRLRVATVTALAITVAGTPLTVNATGRTTLVVNRAKKVVNPAIPNTYYNTIEQYYSAMDLSELFTDVFLSGFSLDFKPGSMATFTATFVGLDHQVLVSGASPYFTTPSVTTGLALVADDSVVNYAGTDVAILTGFSLNFQIEAATQAVLGSKKSPAVFDNDLAVSGTITTLRTDLSAITRYKTEFEFGVSILLQEPLGSPRPFIAVVVPRCKLAKVDAPVGGGDGAKTETHTLMTGSIAAGASQDASLATFFSSAP